MASESDEAAVLLEISDGIARITLNRPAKYNAMNMPFARDFQATVRTIASRSDVAVIILCANGPAFCAGGDVGAMTEVPDLQAYFAAQADALHGGIGQLAALPIAVIAAVRGVVAGGGLGLVLAADLVIAGDNTTFTPAYPKLGFTPDCGVTYHLPRRVGMPRALEYMVGGRTLDAATALEWGIVTEVTAPDAVLDRAIQLAEQARDSAPHALGETRALIRSSFDRGLQQSLDLEAETIVARSAGAEARGLVEAFTASRGARR
jgi:2-(1,2-epoxy-1,2-dihydrophenyl)acetyl-CoA isomerase